MNKKEAFEFLMIELLKDGLERNKERLNELKTQTLNWEYHSKEINKSFQEDFKTYQNIINKFLVSNGENPIPSLFKIMSGYKDPNIEGNIKSIEAVQKIVGVLNQ